MIISRRTLLFIAILTLSIPVASAGDLITDFQIKASNPPDDRYTDIDTITFEWGTSQSSDAVLTVDGTPYTFSGKTSFKQSVGPFSQGTTVHYSLDVQSGNLSDDQSGSIKIENAAPQISVSVAGSIESSVTLVWQSVVRRTLSVEVENGGKQSGSASYSYTGDTTLRSWLDKTSGQVPVSGSSKETVAFTVSVPHTATEKTYSGNIQFQYDGKSKNIPITVTVSQPPAIPKVSDLNLGDVKVGSTHTKSLTITEVGHYKKLTITGVTAKGRLTLINSPREIAAGGSGTINLKLTLPDEAMTPKKCSDDVVISTNVGTKTAEVNYNIPFPELSLYSEKNSYEVSLEPGSSSEVSVPLSIRESGGCNHLKNTRLSYKWTSYPGRNPDILEYFDVKLVGDSFPLIRRGDDKTADLHMTVQGTAPRGVYTLQVSGSASNNNGRVSVEEIEILNIPQNLIVVTEKLDGLGTSNDNRREIKTKTINLLYMVKQELDKYSDDVSIACGLGGDVYEFIYTIENTEYPRSIEQSNGAVDTVSTLHTRYASLVDHLKHFKDKNMIDLDSNMVKNEEECAVNKIIFKIEEIEPKTLCEERSKYGNIREIYMIIGSKEKASKYGEEAVLINQEIEDNKTMAKSYEDEAGKYAGEFEKISGINFVLHYSDCKEIYSNAIEHYESAKLVYEHIGNDCRIDSDRVSGDINKVVYTLDRLEQFRSATIFGFIALFVLLLFGAMGLEHKRIPEKRIEKRCRKLMG